MNDKFVNLENSKRDQKYSNAIKTIIDDGVCPFCSENIKKYHKNPIIEENNSWIATDNMYPYEGTKFHILLIHKKHLTLLDEIGSDAWSELYHLTNLVIKKRKIKGGTIFMRFGDTKFTGATVTHLHAHIVSTDIEKQDRSPILTRIG